MIREIPKVINPETKPNKQGGLSNAQPLQEELPERWKIVKLGELCEFINGDAYKPSDWSTVGTPIIRIQNLNDHSKKFNYWSGSLSKKVVINNGNILLAWSGTPGTSFGVHKWMRGEAVLNQHIFRVDFRNSDIDPDYFVYTVNYHLSMLIDKAHGGVGLRHVTKNEVNMMKISLPPLVIQKRIILLLNNKLSTTENAKRAAEKQLESVGALRAAYLREAFPSAGEKLPEGWLKRKIKEFTSVATGGTPRTNHPEYYDGNIHWMRSGDIKDKDIWDIPILITELGIQNSNAKIHPVGSVMIALSGQGKTRGTSGILRIPSACSQSVAAILPNKEVLPEIIYYNLLNQYQVIREITGDGERTGLNLKIINDLPIIIPPIKNQLEIVKRLDGQYSKSNQMESILKEQLEEIQLLPQAYLRQAFRGEL